MQPVKFVLPEAEQGAWKLMFQTRNAVLPELEKARQAKLIGKSLEAKATLTGAAGLGAHRESLRELLNVSQLEIAEAGNTLAVAITKAAGEKCERCWHWETDVGSHAEHPTLCGRCVGAVKQFKA